MALWDDVKKNLVEWYSITSDKTTEVARVGSRRWDKFGISRDIERQFSELGSLVYIGMKDGQEDILAGEALKEVVSRIENLEEELSHKNEEINSIKTEYQRAAEAKAAAAAAAAAAASQAAEAAEQARAESETAAESEPFSAEVVTDTVLTDPVLEVGAEDSAILVEPAEEAEIEEIQEETVLNDADKPDDGEAGIEDKKA